MFGVGRHGSTTPDAGMRLTDNCLVVVQTPIHAHEFKHDSKHCSLVYLFFTTLMILCCPPEWTPAGWLMHIMLDRYLRGAGTKCFANLLNVYFIFDLTGMLDTLQLLARH